MIVALSGQSSFRLPTGNQSNSAGHMVKAAGLPSAGSLSIEGPPMTWNIHPGLLYESNKLVLNLSHCIFYLFLQHFSLSYLIQNTSNCFFFISLPSCCIYVPASISKFLSTVSLHCIFCLLLSLLKVSLARALTYEMRYCAHMCTYSYYSHWWLNYLVIHHGPGACSARLGTKPIILQSELPAYKISLHLTLSSLLST